MLFYALTFGSRGSCLNMRPLGRMFKLLPRDPANVNALKKNMFDRYSYILYDSMKNLKNHKKVALTLLYTSVDAILFLALYDVIPRKM